MRNKTVIFLGSSVTYGSAAGGWSMCDALAERLGCKVVKYALSGTTLVEGGGDSYVERLRRDSVGQEDGDCFICQLSTNDASQGKELGVISDSFDINSFDTTTIIGAIEYVIAFAREKWNCPIAFYTGTYYDSDAYQNMVDALYRIAEKWGISVIDLWNDTEMRAVSPADYARYMDDPIHPTREGYIEWWTPKFEGYLFGALPQTPLNGTF